MNIPAVNKSIKMLPVIAVFLSLLTMTAGGCTQNKAIVGKKIENAGFNARIAWSSRGDKLAITADRPNGRGGSTTIYIYRVAGSAKPRLLKKLRHDYLQFEFPSWSPDDKYLMGGAIIDLMDFPHILFPEFALIIDVETGRIIRPSPNKTSNGGNHYFWVDNDRIVYQNDNSITVYSLKNSTPTILFSVPNMEDYLTIFKHRFLLGIGCPSGSPPGRTVGRQMLMFDLKTGKSKPLGKPIISDITVADDGRAIIIDGAHWRGRGNNQQYVSGTVRAAKLTLKKLKLGDKLKFRDARGKKLRPISISISPDGKVVAFMAFDRANKVVVYLAEMP